MPVLKTFLKSMCRHWKNRKCIFKNDQNVVVFGNWGFEYVLLSFLCFSQFLFCTQMPLSFFSLPRLVGSSYILSVSNY